MFNTFDPDLLIRELMPQTDDERWMREALREAARAYEEEEVPVGAVLVANGRIIARGHNQVEALQDATAHAEMVCLTAGSAALSDWRLQGATLYCTVEPCAMCAGALLLSRVDALVWGAPDLRHGANGSWVDLFSKKHPTHEVAIRSGVYGEVAAHIMRSFFQQRREAKREEE
jgi:tRNA(adenine34) deaminase